MLDSDWSIPLFFISVFLHSDKPGLKRGPGHHKPKTARSDRCKKRLRDSALIYGRTIFRMPEQGIASDFNQIGTLVFSGISIQQIGSM
jgi:hypothetical protein